MRSHGFGRQECLHSAMRDRQECLPHQRQKTKDKRPKRQADKNVRPTGGECLAHHVRKPFPVTCVVYGVPPAFRRIFSKETRVNCMVRRILLASLLSAATLAFGAGAPPQTPAAGLQTGGFRAGCGGSIPEQKIYCRFL